MSRPGAWLLAGAAFLTFALPGAAQTDEVVLPRPGDTTAFSYRVHRPRGTPRGMVILVGNWGNAFTELERQQIRLHTMLQDSGIATILLSNTPWRTNYFATRSVAILDSLIGAIRAGLGVPEGRVVVGGLQAGGTAALRLAQRCASQACAAGRGLAGVFAVDPIVNFPQFWHSRDVYARGIESAHSGSRRMMRGAMERELGGSPENVPAVYREASIYDPGEPDGGNARLLVTTPLRMYANPDIAWHMREWGTDYVTSGLSDLAGLILMLRRHGNTRAELVAVQGRSTLPDGRPSPHAWRMIDEADIAAWIAGLLRP